MAKTEFHERLAGHRAERGLTQTQMAGKLGISRSTYANYEVGKRTPDLWMLIKIADVFTCSLDELVGLSLIHI